MPNPEEDGFIFGQRHVQTLLLFLGLASSYTLRINLSLAIVAMTDKLAVNPNFEIYQWDEKTKSLLLSSFFMGYIVTQIPAGILVRKYGGKTMVLFGIFVSLVANAITPIGASLGDWQCVFALRVISGFSQGVIFPSTHQLLANWVPVEERSVLGTLAYTGFLFGTAITFVSGGWVASSMVGWPGIFYLTSVVSLIWVVAWMIWGASSPDTCSRISDRERQYIAASLGQIAKSEEEQKFLKVPWKRILTSCPFYALVLAHCSQAWHFWTVGTEIPSYLKGVMHVDIKSNALISAAPYFARFASTLLCAALSAYLNKHKTLTLATSRRLFNTLGTWIPAVILIFITFLGPDHLSLVVVLFMVLGCLNGFTFLGFLWNHIDLSPNFAGILMGLSNFLANVMSSSAPLLAGAIITDQEDQSQWRIIFVIVSLYVFIGNLVFIIFGKFESQPWNEPDNT